LSKHDKIELIKAKAEAMESKAKNFEYGFDAQISHNNTNELNSLYLDSIKAKMALLD
jgi:phage shock protein A